MRGTSDEFPLDLNHTHAFATELVESAHRQVNGIPVFTSGAIIRHGHGDAPVARRDVHRLSAKVLVKHRRIFGRE
jgi:hypothetical protein